MAREFIDGFEAGDFGLWDTGLIDNNSTIVAASTYGLQGNYCFHTYTGWIKRLVTSSPAYYVALRIVVKNNDINQGFMRFLNGSTVLGVFRIDTASAHHIKVYSGNEDVLLATGSSNTPYGTSPYNPFLFEAYYLPKDDGTGQIITKINGITDINITAGVTSPSTLNIDNIQIGSWGADCTYLDDFIVDSADWVGDTNIQIIVPNGAGSITQWTASTGNNWDCVDEIPANDTDYIYTNTNDNIDVYTVSATGIDASRIKSVQIQSRVKKVGSPTPAQIALTLKTNSTVYSGADQALTASYANCSQVWEQNPVTSGSWSTAEIAALQIGVKARA